jgi:RNA 2',3'-cyclic 3'-phosphodiesterase
MGPGVIHEGNYMPVIRAFIGIELPENVQQKLNNVERQIQDRGGETVRRAVRWVPASNIHLTLKFLGDVGTENISAIARMLEEEAAAHSGFDLVIGGLGTFPNPRRPRVIWVGCEGGVGLGKVQKSVDQGTHKLGFPGEERPFSPHLTLGRVGDNARGDELAQLIRALGETKIGELARVQVGQLHLFKSDLRPSGAVYTSLYQFGLAQE